MKKPSGTYRRPWNSFDSGVALVAALVLVMLILSRCSGG